MFISDMNSSERREKIPMHTQYIHRFNIEITKLFIIFTFFYLPEVQKILMHLWWGKMNYIVGVTKTT